VVVHARIVADATVIKPATIADSLLTARSRGLPGARGLETPVRVLELRDEEEPSLRQGAHRRQTMAGNADHWESQRPASLRVRRPGEEVRAPGLLVDRCDKVAERDHRGHIHSLSHRHPPKAYAITFINGARGLDPDPTWPYGKLAGRA
jgi:hypothetical protein